MFALHEATDFTVDVAASAANAVGIEVSEETKEIAKTKIEAGAGLATYGPIGAINLAASIASTALKAPKNLDAAIQVTAQGIETGNAERIWAGFGGVVEHGATIAVTVSAVGGVIPKGIPKTLGAGKPPGAGGGGKPPAGGKPPEGPESRSDRVEKLKKHFMEEYGVDERSAREFAETTVTLEDEVGLDLLKNTHLVEPPKGSNWGGPKY